MLTNVLLRHVLRVALISVPLAVLFCLFFLDLDAALAAAFGGILAAANGSGLIYIVGRLLDPLRTAANKSTLVIVLLVKLAFTAGLLWMALAVWNVDGLGLLLGLAAGFLAVVVGANRGSTSKAGREAMERDEEAIRRDLDGEN